MGTPNAFQFNLPHPGSIVNLGHLAVSPGQNLSLVGEASSTWEPWKPPAEKSPWRRFLENKCFAFPRKDTY
uniref:Uncharacterized protein n=1 Tax=Desertifilum tharense IPPAS B-1220 TaxID=1781255 RepID=A0ACD5GXT1_9CYAN